MALPTLAQFHRPDYRLEKIGPRKAEWRSQYGRMVRKLKRLPVNSPEFRELVYHGYQLACRCGNDCFEHWRTLVPMVAAPSEDHAAREIVERFSDDKTSIYIQIDINAVKDGLEKVVRVHLHPAYRSSVLAGTRNEVAGVVADHLRQQAAAMLAIADKLEA